MLDKLHVTRGTEGPKHDPYSYSEYTLGVHSLRLGVREVYQCGKEVIATGPDAVNKFHAATGLELDDLHEEEEKFGEPLEFCPSCSSETACCSGFASEPVVYCKNKNCQEPYRWLHPDPRRFCE